MKISYSGVTSWLKANWIILLVCEVICLLLATIYLALAPRIYEASFSIRLPKMQISNPHDPSRLEWKLMLSGLDYMRGIQSPMTFSNAFIRDCMGEDSNANRRKFVNSMQIGLLHNADVLQFMLRIQGRENVIRCSGLLEARVLEDLNGIYEIQIQKDQEKSHPALIYEKGALISSLRLSDSFVQPQIIKTIYAALVAGIFLGFYVASLRAKYRG